MSTSEQAPDEGAALDPPEVWVVVASLGGDDGPMVQHTPGASRQVAMKRAAEIEQRYGPCCRIARLVFEDSPPDMSARNNSPAFPVERITAHGILAHTGLPEGDAAYIAALAKMTAGMSRHDYFAAHAPSLPRFVLDSFVNAGKKGSEMDLNEHANTCARWARLYADAMLRELGK